MNAARFTRTRVPVSCQTVFYLPNLTMCFLTLTTSCKWKRVSQFLSLSQWGLTQFCSRRTAAFFFFLLRGLHFSALESAAWKCLSVHLVSLYIQNSVHMHIKKIYNNRHGVLHRHSCTGPWSCVHMQQATFALVFIQYAPSGNIKYIKTSIKQETMGKKSNLSLLQKLVFHTWIFSPFTVPIAVFISSFTFKLIRFLCCIMWQYVHCVTTNCVNVWDYTV